MSRNGLKLVFGKDTANSQIRHISEVPSGKACNCICPQCGSALIAKKGKIKQHHFSHDNLDDCGLQNESFLHLYAKRVLARENTITLPEFEVRHQGRTSRLLATKVRFDNIQDEAPLGSYRADAIASLRNHTLVIEFAVTHTCEDEKTDYINGIQQSAVELDLSRTPLDEDLDIIDNYILHTSPRHWIYNSKEKELKSRIDNQIHTERIEKERIKEWRKRKDAERISRIEKGIKNQFKNDNEKSTSRTLIFCRDSYQKCRDFGFEEHVQLKFGSNYLFLVPSHYWQSSIMNMFILRRIEKDADDWSFRTKDVSDWICKKDYNYVRRDFHYISNEMKDHILTIDENFHTPYELVQAYLQYLEEQNVISSYRYRYTVRIR
jgi:hypothetical protein